MQRETDAEKAETRHKVDEDRKPQIEVSRATFLKSSANMHLTVAIMTSVMTRAMALSPISHEVSWALTVAVAS